MLSVTIKEYIHKQLFSMIKMGIQVEKTKNTPPLKFGVGKSFFIFLERVSYAQQGCIYLIKTNKQQKK